MALCIRRYCSRLNKHLPFDLWISFAYNLRRRTNKLGKNACRTLFRGPFSRRHRLGRTKRTLGFVFSVTAAKSWSLFLVRTLSDLDPPEVKLLSCTAAVNQPASSLRDAKQHTVDETLPSKGAVLLNHFHHVRRRCNFCRSVLK